MSYRGLGVGPYYPPQPQYVTRAGGIGPFLPVTSYKTESRDAGGQWMQINGPQNCGWKQRRRGGRFDFKSLAAKAWKNIKSAFIPIAQKNGKAFLKSAVSHAIAKGPEYLSAFSKDGLSGVRNMFLDNASTIATDFIRSLSDRGSGPACDALTTVFTHARPHMAQLLSSRPCQARSDLHDTAADYYCRGAGGTGHDLVAIAPLQMALDVIMGQIDQQSTQRGGILPLLIPAIGSVIGSLVTTIPKFVEMARARRGSGVASEVDDEVLAMFREGRPFPIPPYTTSRKRGGAASGFDVQLDSGPKIFISTSARPGHEKVIIKRAGKSGKGRPNQRTYYVDNIDAFFPQK